MKKLLAFMACVSVVLAGCGQPQKETNAPPETKKTEAKSSQEVEGAKESKDEKQPDAPDAEAVVNALIDAGIPVDNITVYTAENDPNELLGRPNQYTSKVNFADTRLDQSGDDPVGGSVEVFANEEDAKNRYDYVDGIGEKMSLFAQYLYLTGPVLLRLDKSLTPDQAKEYQDAFDKFLDE